jgi:hypothetical protein
VYPVPFEINKKKLVFNIHALKHLSDDVILKINFFQPDLKMIPEIGKSTELKNLVPTGRLQTFNAPPS